MALNARSKLALGISLFIALIAVFWPVDYVPHAFMVALERAGCPLVRL